MGRPITAEINTNFKNSWDNIAVTCAVLCPKILRIPISFLFRSAVNAANPNKPKQEIRMARPPKYLDKTEIRFSEAYSFW